MTTGVHHYEDKLLEFAYGELPSSEADTVDAHVRGCARCAESLAQIRSVRRAMHTLPMEAAPEAGLESLLAYAEQQAKRNAEAAAPTSFLARWFSPRRVTTFGTVAALMVVGVVAWKAKDEVESPATMALRANEAAADSDRPVEHTQLTPSAERPPPPVGVAAPEPAPKVAQRAPGTDRGDLDRAKAESDEFEAAFGQGGEASKNEKRKVEKKVAEAKQLSSGSLIGRASGGKGPGVSSGSSPVVVPAEEALANDYSNASLQGPRAKTAAAPSPAPATAPDSKYDAKPSLAVREKAEVAALTKDAKATSNQDRKPAGGGYGLTGGAADDLVEGQQQPTLRDELARVGGTVGTRAEPRPSKEQPSAPAVANAAPPPPQAPAKKGSLAFPSSTPSAAYDQGPADKHGTERADGTGASVADRRHSTLEAAREAFARNDRQAEVRSSLDALSLGVTGSERLEALRRACDGLDALGEPDQAEAYCTTLQREFPSSSAAEAVSRRRLAAQKPSPVKSPKRAAEQQFESEKKAAPASKSSAPAQAY